MARYQSYRCPECGGVFRHFHHPSDSPPPDRCPLCKAWVSDDEPAEPAFLPQAPGIRKSAYVKSVDQTYRNMEAASIERAEEAAGILETAYAKQPRDEEFSGLVEVTQREQIAKLKSDLKLTDMKDPSEMRPGDVAAIMPPMKSDSPVAKGAGFQTFAGPAPDHLPGVGGGRQALESVRTATAGSHSSNAARLIQAGNMGTYRRGE